MIALTDRSYSIPLLRVWLSEVQDWMAPASGQEYNPGAGFMAIEITAIPPRHSSSYKVGSTVWTAWDIYTVDDDEDTGTGDTQLVAKEGTKKRTREEESAQKKRDDHAAAKTDPYASATTLWAGEQ